MQNRNIIQYSLESGPDNKLEAQVNQLINQGWQPYGAPYVVYVPSEEDGYLGYLDHFQAMVKYQ